MSDWIERKFCPQCGAYLMKSSNGDVYCSKCNLSVKETPRIDLNKIDEDLLDHTTFTKISERINDHTNGEKIFNIDRGCIEHSQKPNTIGAKKNFLRLIERFGLALTKYYEAAQNRKIADYSKDTGYGYDILSTSLTSNEDRYIEVKTRLGGRRSITLTQKEYDFLIKGQSNQKWIYIVFIDRGELIDKNYQNCFEFQKIPSTRLKEANFQFINPSKPTIRYKTLRPASERCRVTLPNRLEPVLHQIREKYITLFPERANRIQWFKNNHKNEYSKRYHEETFTQTKQHNLR